MSRRKSMFAVVALALLALVASATPGASLGGATDVALDSSDCCCAADPRFDVASTCDCCCDSDDDAGPPGPCDCENGGEELPPLFPAPVHESISAPEVLRWAHTPTIPPSGEDLWHAGVDRRASTGPPIHVRHCVWLI